MQRISPVSRTIARLVSGRPAGRDANRLLQAIVALLLGLCILSGAALSDVYLHRGVETSAALPFVVQVSGRDLATNVDLRSFAPEDVDQVATTLQQNGFRVVRQLFAWSSIEPQQGEFSWDRYDQIVEALNAHGIQIVAVLARTPEWARATPIPDGSSIIDSPPADILDYADFVQAVVSRYKTDVAYVQLWDQPNSADHWGGTAATPVAYADLLANSFNAARTGAPETQVVLAEFDPEGDGHSGADLRFLKSIYRLGRSDFFDVVAARIDGGTQSPHDRTVLPQKTNLARAVLFRELMIREGDEAKPIWLTHYGWKRAPEGTLTADEQAAFLLAGMERARSEWPWLGLMFSWDLMPNGTEPNSAPYSLLNDDSTATPSFVALSAYGMSSDAVLAGTGFVPMESRPITYQRTWADQHLEERTFRTTSEVTAAATLKFEGTGVIANLRFSSDAGRLRVTLDGGPVPGLSGDANGSLLDLRVLQASNIWLTLASGLKDGPHELVLTLDAPGQLTIGGMVISRDLPLVWPVALLTVAAFILVVIALRELAFLAATRSGYLQRRTGVELLPPLPHMPDWIPSRRA